MKSTKSKSRIYLAQTKERILKLFDYKCIMCGKPTREVHEIVPISHGKKSLAGKNRVPLCRGCHGWAHNVGTRNSVPILSEKRAEFLRKKWSLRCHK